MLDLVSGGFLTSEDASFTVVVVVVVVVVVMMVVVMTRINIKKTAPKECT